MALVPVDASRTAMAISTFGLTQGKQKPRDFQRTTELVCKFIVDTTQLLNRLAAHCDDTLQKVSRDLQRFELQLRLLEYKLDSIDEEEGRASVDAEARRARKDADREQARADKEARAAAREEAAAAAANAGAGGAALAGGGGGGGAIGAPPGTTGRPLAIGAPPGTRGAGGAVPQMPGRGGHAPASMQVPGAAGGAVPLPPGMAGKMPPGAAGAAAAVPPPPPMSRIVAAPPPMPQSAGLTMRKHPKLKGYFEMLEAGVPAPAIKARMGADGYKPEWLDTPDIQSALPSMTEAQKKTFFDSD